MECFKPGQVCVTVTCPVVFPHVAVVYQSGKWGKTSGLCDIHSLQSKQRALPRKFPLESDQASRRNRDGDAIAVLSRQAARILPRLSLIVLGVLTNSIYMGSTVCVPLIIS